MTSLLFLAALACVCAGVWLIYMPAGLIAAGACLGMIAFGIERARSGSPLGGEQ